MVLTNFSSHERCLEAINTMKIRNSDADLEEYFELDVLRGWREVRDRELVAAHALPALAALIQIDSETGELDRIEIHGPDVIVGRFQPQYGPVDLVPGNLRDHENYRLGVPHLYVRCDETGWGIRLLTTSSATYLAGEKLEESDRYYSVSHGDELKLGVARFVFESCEKSLECWQDVRGKLLREVDGPALFLKRNGGICGAFLRLDRAKASVIGRTSPEKGEVPGTQGWLQVPVPEWDLAGLEDRDRKHIAFRHARVLWDEGHWWIEPMSQRQWTFVNRQRVRGLTRLEAGDEVGLGSVLFYFHDGQWAEGAVNLERTRIELPEVLTWNDGHVSRSVAGREKALVGRKK